jgi:xanthine dehydrogenase small subunit
VIDLTRVAELQRIEHYPNTTWLLAQRSALHDAFAALAKRRPEVTHFAHRFAGRPVRQSGTLGGNMANGSPIGDSMPLLIALGAQVVLMAWRKRSHGQPTCAALENYYLGYQKPFWLPTKCCVGSSCRIRPGEWLHCYKVSKRVEDDIPACAWAKCALHMGKA